MRSNNKRDQVLEAALKVVEEKGANHLTMDAVATRAGFSKGGVLYHFPSKQALLSGMLDLLIRTNQEKMNASGNSGGNLLLAMLNIENKMTPAERRASLAILAAVAEGSDLMAPAKAYMKQLLDQVSSQSTNPMESLTLFLAREGIRYLEILDISPMDNKQTRDVMKHLSQRAEEL